VVSTGTSNFCTEASDSPSSVRKLAAALLSAFKTSCLVAASSCSLARVSPLLQLTASTPITYCPPMFEIEPDTIPLLPVRTQSSLATSWVMRMLGWRPMSRRVSPTLRSERILMNGDCPSCTASACFIATSKTVSPVVLSKSDKTMSFSVSGVALATGVAERERKYNPTPMAAATSIAAAGTRAFQSFLPPATETSATFTAPDEGDAQPWRGWTVGYAALRSAGWNVS
jgi:hypothetical protein